MKKILDKLACNLTAPPEEKKNMIVEEKKSSKI